MLHLDAAKCMPLIGLMLAQQARQELEKGCESFPATVKAKVRKLYEHADASRKDRECRTDRCWGSDMDEEKCITQFCTDERPKKLRSN